MNEIQRGIRDRFIRIVRCKLEMYEMFEIGVNAGLIWAHLMEEGDMGAAQIAEGMFADEDQVRECLWYMEAAELVHKHEEDGGVIYSPIGDDYYACCR